MKNWIVAIISILVLITISPAHSKPAKISALSIDSMVLKIGKSKDGKGLLKISERKFKQAHAYTFSSKVVTYKRGKKIKQSGTFYYKDPNLVRFEVARGGKNSGAVVVRQPNGKVKGKSGGFLGKFVIPLSPNSGLLKAANGFNILKSDFESLFRSTLKRIKPGSQSCLATAKPYKLSNKNVYIVELLDSKKKVSERLVLDAKNKLPLQWILFRKAKLLSVTYFNSIKLNAVIPNEYFVLGSAKLANAKFVDPESLASPIDEDAPTYLSKRALEDLNEVLQSIRIKANNLKKVQKKKVIPDEVRRYQLAESARMEIAVDKLRVVNSLFVAFDKRLHKEDQLTGKWQKHTENIATNIEAIFNQLQTDEIDNSVIEQRSDSIIQQTKNLDGLISKAKLFF